MKKLRQMLAPPGLLNGVEVMLPLSFDKHGILTPTGDAVDLHLGPEYQMTSEIIMSNCTLWDPSNVL